MPASSASKKFPCLRCGKLFESEANATNHMNQPQALCRYTHENVIHFNKIEQDKRDSLEPHSPDVLNTNNLEYPDADAGPYSEPMEGIKEGPQLGPSIFSHPTPQERTQSLHCEDFPLEGAHRTWNETHPGKTFMALFAENPLSSTHENLPYYPFSTRTEWEVASFLLQSGMSMAKIDQFLKLEIALMHSPLVSDYIQFTPFKLYETCAKTMRVYTEWLSGDAAWFMQEKLQPSATLLGTILLSDKTNISAGTGNCYAHPLLISLANIAAEFRNKATNHAFLLLALIPLETAAGALRPAQPTLLTHPTLFKQFGDAQKHPMRTGQMTLDALAKIQAIVEDEWDLELYEKEAMKYWLNGVHKPFWRDWDLSNPAVFLTSEPLHHWHRMFWDHDVKWCINAVGAAEIDFRFSILLSHTGFRHFKEGISSLKQVTGREQHDIQRYIIPVVADDICHMIDESLSIFHQFKKAIIDAGARQGEKGWKLNHWQIPKLEFMQSITAGIRLSRSAIQWSADTTEHAHIKLVKEPARASNQQNYDPQIVRRLDCKDKVMNFDLATAMHNAGVEFKDKASSAPQQSMGDDDQDPGKDLDSSDAYDMAKLTIGTTAELLSLISSVHALPGSHAGSAGINTYNITNYFYKASILKKGLDASAKVPYRTVQNSPTTVFHLSQDLQMGICTIGDISQQFGIEDLGSAISRYISKIEANHPNTFISEFNSGAPTHHPHFMADKIQVWTSLRLQSTAYHYPHPIQPPVTLKAEPGLGGHDSAIFCVDSSSQWPWSSLSGHVVTEICLIFRLVLPKNRWHIPDRFLAYVQKYTIIPQPNARNTRQTGEFPDSCTGLYLLKRSALQQPTSAVYGDIIPLDQLHALVDVVPNFGGKADTRLTCKNSLAYSHEFWLNKSYQGTGGSTLHSEACTAFNVMLQSTTRLQRATPAKLGSQVIVEITSQKYEGDQRQCRLVMCHPCHPVLNLLFANQGDQMTRADDLDMRA
ncbi:hypothetical protein BJ165DRAFT_1410263 [Panaeolus papilionaceus]|nr:hypothetical protein BJ165DRAFT_1410263 [Panaeolus papilionaceus]